MNRPLPVFDVLYGPAATAAGAQRVLRNTYALLALSMVPTVAGAWLGVATGLMAAMGPIASVLLFLGGSFALMYGIERNKTRGLGVVLLLVFTFFMGLMLSRMLGYVLGGYKNGGSLIMTAFAGTAGIFTGMALLATVVKRDLSFLSRFLFVGMLVVFVGGLVNLFVQSSAGAMMLSMAVMAIFSLFILVDVKRVIDGGETNYVMATLAIYLDLYNVFQSLLMLLTSFSGERD